MEIYCPPCWQHNSCIIIIILFGKNLVEIWERGLARHSYFLSLSWEYINWKLFAVQAIEWNLLLEGNEDVSNSSVPKKLTDSVMKSSFYPLPRRIQNQSWWNTKDERKRVDFSANHQIKILINTFYKFKIEPSVWNHLIFLTTIQLFKIQYCFYKRLQCIPHNKMYHIFCL